MKYQAGFLQLKGAGAFIDALGTSITDALEFAKRLRTPLVVLGILYVLGSLAGAFLTPLVGGTTGSVHDGTASVDYHSNGGTIFILILAFFILAEAVRTIVPEFRMTAGRFFSLLGWSILTALCVAFGFVLLLVPGVYLIGKLLPAGYIVLLRPRENPFGLSWEVTKGFFWPTIGLVFITAMAAGVIGGLAGSMEAVVANIPLAALLLSPVAFALHAFGAIVTTLTYVRWTNELLLVRDSGSVKSLTPTQAAGIVP